jgi:asparagine synthase (glutamine-hydrolysing)
MCGFVSVISNTGHIEKSRLIAMRDQLIHRGPDAAGIWIAGNIGFGQRRLSIVDPVPQSDQPMASPDGRFILNYNGEIYNYVELKKQLTSLGVSFKTKSDTEVLLQSLIVWGAEAIPRLNGMFAFSFWDNDERTMVIARDRFGEKPLFYYSSPRFGFACASEMKALFADARVPDCINQEMMEVYQTSAYYEDGERTMFQEINRLEPAHFAIIDSRGRIKKKVRYWTPDYGHIDSNIKRPDAVEHFGVLLRESVRKRLRSDVPVGSSLSGGMDSSAIVGEIAFLRAQGIATATQEVFSARFEDDPTLNEGPYIDQVVRFNGVTPRSTSPSPDGLMDEIYALHWHQEEPFMSASIYLQWCVARLAKNNDVTVLLDGQGADELLGGYQFYYRQYQQDLIDKHQALRAVKETLLFNSRLSIAAMGYRNSKRRFNDRTAMRIPEVMRRLNLEEPVYTGMYSHGMPPIEAGFRVRKQMAEALQYNTLPQLLRYADRNSMAFSREARLPYLDHELVDFTLTLPDDILFNNGWQKYPLRKSMDGLVPNSVRWRADKVGYAAPLDVWMRGPMKEWAYTMIFESSASKLEHFDRGTLLNLWKEHQAGANHSWAFWRWISLGIWIDMVQGGNLRRPLRSRNFVAGKNDIAA